MGGRGQSLLKIATDGAENIIIEMMIGTEKNTIVTEIVLLLVFLAKWPFVRLTQ